MKFQSSFHKYCKKNLYKQNIFKTDVLEKTWFEYQIVYWLTDVPVAPYSRLKTQTGSSRGIGEYSNE